MRTLATVLVIALLLSFSSLAVADDLKPVLPAAAPQKPDVPTPTPGHVVPHNPLPASPAEVPSEAELNEWLIGLDSNKYAEREAATTALAEAGAAAVPYLKQAALGESLEAADRAVWVLKQFSESTDDSLKMHSLEVLVQTERFPGVVRDAAEALADLQEQLCRQELEQLGAEFTSEMTNVSVITMEGSTISVNVNREEWKGSVDDLMKLTKLRQVSMLRVAAKELTDKQACQLADIPGLEILELVETKTTVACVDQLKQTHPDLRVRLKNRAMLGVSLIDSGSPSVSRVHAGKPAAKAGMQAGDVILKFAGHDINTFDELTTRISQQSPGDKVEVVVRRETTDITLEVTLEDADWTNGNPLAESPDADP